MIHNAWTFAMGNSAELRKQADDLEKITQASVEAYKSHSSLSEEEIKKLMDNETWILPEEALSYGFATTLDKTENKKASQSAWLQLFDIIKAHQEKPTNEDEEPENDLDDDEEEDKDNDTEGEESPKNEPETDSEDEEEQDKEEQSEEVKKTENDEEKTTQLWSGFFNALKK
jgi:ATP-dependent Clp protease protease subunit